MKTRYVLLTAAKDEEAFIPKVIEAVLQQSILPVAWFIMDDGSKDNTPAIVNAFAKQHPFIRLQTAGERAGRNFGSQYKAIMAAYGLAKSLEFDLVAVEDADQAPVRRDHYETLLGEFDRNPRLGIASGYLYERYKGAWQSRRSNSKDSIAGGSAIFRRECFEEVGGYTPLYHGGSDWLIQIDAKMAGWELLVRPELHVLHYRPTSSASGLCRGLFRAGLMDASFGSHTVFEVLKCCRRVTTPPFLIGSLIRFFGFAWWRISVRKPVIRTEASAFLRKEQLAKMQSWVAAPGGSR